MNRTELLAHIRQQSRLLLIAARRARRLDTRDRARRVLVDKLTAALVLAQELLRRLQRDGRRKGTP